MKMIRHDEKTATVIRPGEPARTTGYNRRFIRDARPSTQGCGSGTFWYPIWRNIRKL